MFETARRCSPWALIASPASRRSRTSRAQRRSSPPRTSGTVASAASVAGARSSIASCPAGDRSGSRSSPGRRPSAVARMGSSSASALT